jgi:hypothetical protein
MLAIGSNRASSAIPRCGRKAAEGSAAISFAGDRMQLTNRQPLCTAMTLRRIAE